VKVNTTSGILKKVIEDEKEAEREVTGVHIKKLSVQRSTLNSGCRIIFSRTL